MKKKNDELIGIHSGNQNIFMRFFYPNVVTKYCKVAKSKNKKEFQDLKNYYSDLLKLTKKRKKGITYVE